MQYRREIDGLRAVAVLPVILFHAGASIFSGGFVGVDVFFVISGYLITSILIAEREAGTYSLMGFYERRARRILPALFLVLLVTIPFAWAWIPPYPFEDYARSLAFASLFISNMHFLEHGGYFDLNSELRPLLHTWSLAVEEQYYLVFPLLLVVLGRFGKAKHLLVFGMLALGSLILAEWGWRNFPNQNFYFTPARFWEMLAGSICAVLLFQRGQMKSEVLAGLGLAMIVGSSLFYHAAIPFPSVYALTPVTGTVLIIIFGEKETLTARLLSIKPLVGVGLISYSAYLWHQPLFAFARLRAPFEVPLPAMMGLAVLSLVLAYLSWRFVEQPVRGRSPMVLPTQRGVMTVSLIGIIGFAAFGLVGKAQEGFTHRIGRGQSAFLDRLYEQTTNETPPFFCAGMAGGAASSLCHAYGTDDAPRKIAVLGDSHALALAPAFAAAATELDAKIMVGVGPACPPLLGVYTARGADETQQCHDAMRAYAQTIASEGYNAVALVARWSVYANGDYDGPDPQFRLSEIPGQRFISEATQRASFEKGMRETIEHFADAGVKVLLVHQVPQQRATSRIVVQNAMLLGLGEDDARDWFASGYVTQEESDALQRYSRGVIEGLAGGDEMIFTLTLDELFADGDHFAWLKGNDALYRDDDHVSVAATSYLAPYITKSLAQMVR